jgi:hypothetical protein
MVALVVAVVVMILVGLTLAEQEFLDKVLLVAKELHQELMAAVVVDHPQLVKILL